MQLARDSYRDALEAFRAHEREHPGTGRADIAVALNNLGSTQVELHEPGAARDSFLEASELCEEDAALRPGTRLDERLLCWSNLGTLYLSDVPELGWPDLFLAREALRKARSYAEALRASFIDDRQRARVHRDALRVYEALVGTCVDIALLTKDREALCEAVEVAEASRARRLMELLADEILQPTGAPPDLVTDFRELRRELRQALRAVEYEESRPQPPARASDRPAGRPDRPPGPTWMRSPGTISPADQPARSQERHGQLGQQVERVAARYNAQLAQIRSFDKEFDPDRPVPPIDFRRIKQLLPVDIPTAFVHYTLTRHRAVAVVVIHSGLEAVALPGLDTLRALVLAANWYRGYDDGRDFSAWAQRLPDLLEPVARLAVRPVVEAIAGRGIERLILAPNQSLHVFPLHACRMGDGRYLSEAFEVGYTPSLSILDRCDARRRDPGARLLTVENPTEDLFFPGVEIARISRFYPDRKARTGRQATRAWLLDQSRDRDLWHYSGHTKFEPAAPLSSALRLEDARDPLRLARALRDYLLRPANAAEPADGLERLRERDAPARPDRRVRRLPQWLSLCGCAVRCLQSVGRGRLLGGPDDGPVLRGMASRRDGGRGLAPGPGLAPPGRRLDPAARHPQPELPCEPAQRPAEADLSTQGRRTGQPPPFRPSVRLAGLLGALHLDGDDAAGGRRPARRRPGSPSARRVA